MNILIACEFSGIVREAFRRKGHDAWSCDLLEAEDGSPYHIKGDCIEAIKGDTWDIIIMHPPCTALAVSGNRWYGTGMPKHQERLESIEWTIALWELAKQHANIGVCMENPVGVLPVKPTQYIQPWQFGHGETKKTGLWLHKLPPLVPTNIVEGREQRIWKLPPSADRWKIRSATFPGIAAAMANQWG
jgi:site-specific DNA-cytosine methylase